MSGLAEISVSVESSVSEDLSRNVIALLHEITTLQEQFINTGEIGQIDLMTLPLTSGEQKALDTVLGVGEVRCQLDAAGRSEINETLMPGVWRIRYFSVNDDLVAELIEISEVPEIIKAGMDELKDGMQALKAQLTEIAQTINADGE